MAESVTMKKELGSSFFETGDLVAAKGVGVIVTCVRS